MLRGLNVQHSTLITPLNLHIASPLATQKQKTDLKAKR